MKRNLDNWSLVVVGHWNTAILSPDWLAKEVFRQEEVRIMYPVLGGGRPIFEAANIRVIASRERLEFRPTKDDPELLNRIETGARNVLNILPHTPVSAFGENFQYLVEDVPKELREVLSLADTDKIGKHGAVSEVSLSRSIKLQGRHLNLTITESDKWRMDLNYHYSVPGDGQPGADAAKLMENTYTLNRDHGLQFLETIYGLVLQEGAMA